MKNFLITIFLCGMFITGVAQTFELKDSVITLANDTLGMAQSPADSIASKVEDTVQIELVATPSDFEFIPADATPELIADRLHCLERTIPLEYNSKVQAFINYFTVRDREYTRSMLRRKDLYFPLFERKLKEYNLPDELKYLSIIESALNPKATSGVHAVGLWQFMSGTGRYLGLQCGWSIDERMDPEKSTDAACRYLSQLYSIFHDWPMALAAYNSGPGTVLRAIRRSGHKRTFWEVYNHLPRETRSYVPQFIAMVYAINYANEHNIHEDARETIIPYDTLAVSNFFHFEIFSKLTNTCAEDLQALNPSMKRNAVPYDGETHVIKIPKASKEILMSNRKAILDSAATGKKEWEEQAKKMSDYTYGREQTVYYVRSGDALSLIAQRFGVSVTHLKEWNHLRSNNIRIGQRLTVWVLPRAKTSTASRVAPRPSSPLVVDPAIKTYIVQPGDTLWDISKKLPGITVEKIKDLNNLKGNQLKPGQKLIVG